MIWNVLVMYRYQATVQSKFMFFDRVNQIVVMFGGNICNARVCETIFLVKRTCAISLETMNIQ